MSIVVYGTVVSQDKVPVTGSVKITQEGVFVSENGIIVPKTITKELNGSGYFSQELDTPISGTVLTTFELPTGHSYGLHLATGAATDLATLITAEGSAVEACDLLTLIQLEKIFRITNVTAEYTVLATDEYLYCTSSPTPIHLPECVLGTTGPLMVDNGSNVNITVDGYGAETINGSATLTIVPGDRRTFIPNADGSWRA